jgi:hypothetical protein
MPLNISIGWNCPGDATRHIAKSTPSCTPLTASTTVSILSVMNDAVQHETQECCRTLRVPPCEHKTCTICISDFIIPVPLRNTNDDDDRQAPRCAPCRICEKCNRKMSRRWYGAKRAATAVTVPGLSPMSIGNRSKNTATKPHNHLS